MTDNTLENSVVKLKVMDALRSPSADKLSQLANVYNLMNFPFLLGLAVQSSAQLAVVAKIVELYHQAHRDINEQNEDGNCALHIAVARSRNDLAAFLLSQPEIDDTVANDNGQTPLDIVPNPVMAQALQQAQQKFVESTAVRLWTAFKAQDLAQLEQIYSNPRVPELLDINGTDPETGSTVLHDAAHANNLKLVQFILAHGGNPLVQNQQGKLPSQVTSNDSVKRLLNDQAKSAAILDQNAQSQGGKVPPQMSGFLKKWTNITTGYRMRWFVLENGVLSYYKKPQDAQSSCRGSITMRSARVRLDSSEKNRFEVKTPTAKFHLKAAHAVEASRWVWALQNAITFAKDAEKARTSSDRQGRRSLSAPQQHSRRTQSVASVGSTGSKAGAGSTGGSHLGHRSNISVAASETDRVSANNIIINDLAVAPDDDDDASVDTEKYDDDEDTTPAVSLDSMLAQLAALKDLFATLGHRSNGDSEVADAVTTGQRNIDVLSGDLRAYAKYGQRLLINLDRSEKNQKLWAQNVRDLQLEQERLEGQIFAYQKNAAPSQHEDSDEEFFDTVDGWDAPQASSHGASSAADASEPAPPGADVVEPELPTITESREGAAGGSGSGPGSGSGSGSGAGIGAGVAAAVAGAAGALGLGHAAQTQGESEGAQAQGPQVSEAESQVQGEPRTGTDAASQSGGYAAGQASGQSGQATEEVPEASTEATGPEADKEASSMAEEADAGAGVPNPASSEVHSKAKKDGLTDAQEAKNIEILDENSFAGYEEPPRTKLAIDDDKRPRISLWGILKNAIGKDMTRMTLPVAFNECVSLLQRSAEDMEYVSLLDKAAAAVDDPELRMAYVAAFAVSSYSSTINRVAKPFNPLLGETYEYCRPDQEFRLMAEQVSHHPPIGALIAESPRWDFYGESNVDSKFKGRSFDINPLGLWYLNLRPNAGADVESELYSYRKVTSSVVGIMVGNPVVDNYGTMQIRNHTTGVTCELVLKPRGWRGASAYKLEGTVKDPSGKEVYSVGGSWDDKIYAKRLDGSKGKLLLWQVHERPSAPFNLTPFAITLNGLEGKLANWLPPTDTRLRPDQRCMEEGRYDEASNEKNRVEEKQRAARKQREAENITYKPQWFELVKHPVTGQDYYKPINDYWGHRKAQALADKGDIF